jgi:hypothetical protein
VRGGEDSVRATPKRCAGLVRWRGVAALVRGPGKPPGGFESPASPADRLSDPLAPARGIVVCFVIGVALWAVIISVWAVLVR